MTVILCPGQGAQALNMGKAWCDASAAARAIFTEADAVLGAELGAPLSQLCFEGPVERLNQTDVAQPALYTAAVACYHGLVEAEGSFEFDLIAGLSLGEYTALHLAGVFSFVDGLRLVAQRGRFMQDAARASAGGMVAMTKPTDEEAESICAAARENDILVCANFNAPGQVVLSGSQVACERAAALAGDRGHRATILKVAGAFHSDLMAPAAEKMVVALEKCDFLPPQCAVVSNVTATPHDGENLKQMKELLVKQIVSPVKWNQSCQWIVNNLEGRDGAGGVGGGGDVHELAPGKVLTGLMRRIHRETKVINHDKP